MLMGSARVSRAGEAVSGSRTFAVIQLVAAIEIREQVRSGGTPKPSRETRALPKRYVVIVELQCRFRLSVRNVARF